MTGASSGIGEAFADELSSRRVDLILVGRQLEALSTVATRARRRGVQVDVLLADISTEEGVATVVDAIGSAYPRVDLLVNNAGLGQWGLFAELPLDRATETIRVNNEALVKITYAALRPMLDEHHGGIIQISSLASRSPGPQQAVYAATKAFISSFGQALSLELLDTGVTCTTVMPGLTRTNYFARAGFSPDVPAHHWMMPEQVAHAALEAAGDGRPLVVPGARNRLKVSVSTQFPSLPAGRAKHRFRQTLSLVRHPRPPARILARGRRTELARHP